MPREIIEKIKAAENDAEEILKTGAAQAKKIVADAENEAFHIRERAVMESEAEYVLLMEKAGDANKEKARIIIEEAREAASELKRASGRNMDEAVKMIAGKVIGKYGDR